MCVVLLVREVDSGQNLIMERISMRKEQISLRQIRLGKSPRNCNLCPTQIVTEFDNVAVGTNSGLQISVSLVLINNL